MLESYFNNIGQVKLLIINAKNVIIIGFIKYAYKYNMQMIIGN